MRSLHHVIKDPVHYTCNEKGNKMWIKNHKNMRLLNPDQNPPRATSDISSPWNSSDAKREKRKEKNKSMSSIEKGKVDITQRHWKKRKFSFVFSVNHKFTPPQKSCLRAEQGWPGGSIWTWNPGRAPCGRQPWQPPERCRKHQSWLG